MALASIMMSSSLGLLHSSSLSLPQAIPITGSSHERQIKPIKRKEPYNSSLSDQSKALSWGPLSFFFSQLVEESSLPAPAEPVVGGDSHNILQDATAPHKESISITSSYKDAMNTDARPNHTDRSYGHRKKRRVVVFTPQKARELRRRLRDTDSFHDLMYHSAIASRLASDDHGQKKMYDHLQKKMYVLCRHEYFASLSPSLPILVGLYLVMSFLGCAR